MASAQREEGGNAGAQYDETAMIEAIAAQDFAREPELLAIAKQNMPRLPVEEIEVLIIDQLGKNISGSGIDTNIIGRIRIDGEPEPRLPRIKSIVECVRGGAGGCGDAPAGRQDRFQDDVY